jgi:hypothetical protein
MSSAKGSKGYEEWHWGIPHKQVVEWNDADLPEGDLIECGRLVEVHIREPGQRKDTIIKLARKEANGSHLCFDPNHPNQRLYILLHGEFREKMKKEAELYKMVIQSEIDEIKAKDDLVMQKKRTDAGI